MFYEERLVNGVLMCRTAPNSTWQQCSVEKMGERIKQLEYELGQTKIQLEYKARYLAQCESALRERDGL